MRGGDLVKPQGVPLARQLACFVRRDLTLVRKLVNKVRLATDDDDTAVRLGVLQDVPVFCDVLKRAALRHVICNHRGMRVSCGGTQTAIRTEDLVIGAHGAAAMPRHQEQAAQGGDGPTAGASGAE